MCVRRAPVSGDVRRGFTVIELLVVAGIVVLLIGLLLPAVQGARESARRMQCVVNLRQIGTAMHAYHAVHNMFPPSWPLTGRTWSANATSGLAFLLPHLEQQALYASLNTDFVHIEQPDTPVLENHTARNTRVAVFLCPSDGEPNHLNSYRFNQGRFGTRRGRGSLHDGPFSLGVVPSQATVTDGLTQTAFVSERVGGSYIAGAADRVRDLKYTDQGAGLFYSDEQFIPVCLGYQPALWSHTEGRYWLFSGLSTTHYNHNGAPNDPRPSCSNGVVGGHPGGLRPPRSYHPGCVNVLFGDGHVEAVANSIQTRVWLSLGTHDSGD